MKVDIPAEFISSIKGGQKLHGVSDAAMQKILDEVLLSYLRERCVPGEPMHMSDFLIYEDRDKAMRVAKKEFERVNKSFELPEFWAKNTRLQYAGNGKTHEETVYELMAHDHSPVCDLAAAEV